MLLWSVFSLIALTWAAWLFSKVFTGKSKVIAYLSMLIVVVLASAALYFDLGSYKSIKEVNQLHQELSSLDLKQLIDKADKKEITIQQMLTEIRLRSEAEPNNDRLWIQMGQILLQLGELQHAELAFNRAYGVSKDNATRLEAARYFMDYDGANRGTDALKRAEKLFGLVLLDQPSHEGALLLQGINYFKQQQYALAIEYWQRSLALREEGSQSALLIQQQIDMARQQIALQNSNHITIVVNNLSNIPLQSFTKAFVIVKPANGGIPVAVRSLALNELNEAITLGPSDVMLPEVNLWQVTDIKVEIRLSQSGFAKPEPGDLKGSTDTIHRLSPGETFHIIINETVK